MGEGCLKKILDAQNFPSHRLIGASGIKENNETENIGSMAKVRSLLNRPEDVNGEASVLVGWDRVLAWMPLAFAAR